MVVTKFGSMALLGQQEMKMKFKHIGVIRTPFKNKQSAPIQGNCVPKAIGRVKVLKKYADGLKDIDSFSHIYLFYHFHKAGDVQLVRPTFLDDTPHGVFASRHPCRPNGIGFSIVKLRKRMGNTLIVSGVDMLDKTPLLDIKPYIPRFDFVAGASGGWVSNVKMRRKPEGRE
jgi:tRNA-Thr(GGU) m(6)t(6)A37 methyltransferase TsaA